MGNDQEIEWPSPSYRQPGALYTCADCGTVVVPEHGDKEAGLVIAGGTTKLCADCAEEIREAIRTEDPHPDAGGEQA